MRSVVMPVIMRAAIAVKPIGRIQNVPSRTSIDYALEVIITIRR